VTVTGTTTVTALPSGTFTPVLEFGNATTGIIYDAGATSGQYTTIGDVVFVSIAIRLTSKGSATGNATVSGLSIAPALPGTSPVSCIALDMTGLTGDIGASVLVSSGKIMLTQSSATGYAQITNTSFTNTSSVYISGWYRK
jgi:hypothetical protein